MRTLLIISLIAFSGAAYAAEKKTEVFVLDSSKKGSFIIESQSTRGSRFLLGSNSGSSVIVTDPRTQKTIAVLPKGKK